MSTSKGSMARSRPQKHQNRTAFKNDLHDTSTRTKLLNSLDINGVCIRCKNIIEWKIKYKKYKMLSAPRKCVGCEQKTIKHAYHVLCSKCAKEKDVCAKCCKQVDEELIEANKIKETVDLDSLLKKLPERKRRTILRYINKHQGDPSHIDIVMAKIEQMNLDNKDQDFDFSDEDCQESDADSLGSED